MLHIANAKGGFIVANVSDDNGKVLSNSEILETKRSCKTNMLAQLKSIAKNRQFTFVDFQDSSLKEPKCFRLFKDGSILALKDAFVRKRYVVASKKKKLLS